ncbi:60 kda ribonucleoprotein ssa/ro [Anaeramoeba ignava]|uniref:60 kDa ribonucleoprotein ssa/ro n=1 Tax=Anaeramoeba ignava TaxID=1746090 RepID=A0A9Q0RGB3_ANAIG|nr:60 kda ribonucleoprotein ssa/ro [Anaeramoeba ignava]
MSKKFTNQQQPEKGRENDMVRNNAGGFVFEVDDMVRLRRFLTLGCETGTYYQNAPQLKLENTKSITELIDKGRGLEVVETIVEYSVEGRAAKQEPGIFALAICAKLADRKKFKDTIDAAYAAVPKVCRIPTTLFLFVKYCLQFSKLQSKSKGWGRKHRESLAKWYKNDHDAKKLAYLITKYQSREGWSHRDLLRLIHPKPSTNSLKLIFDYIVNGKDALVRIPQNLIQLSNEKNELKTNQEISNKQNENENEKEKDKNMTISTDKNENENENENEKEKEKDKNMTISTDKDQKEMKIEETDKKKKPKQYPVYTNDIANDKEFQQVFQFLETVEKIKKSETAENVIELIKEQNLAREHIPTVWLNTKEIWAALLESMPLTATIRNLGKMTEIGLLSADSKDSQKYNDIVVRNFLNEEYLKKSRIHPFNVFVALKVYGRGKGIKGNLTWKPVPKILNALDEAFYLTFNYVEPTNKRWLLGVDVSGSMSCAFISGNPAVCARDAAAAMMSVITRVEKDTHLCAFSTTFQNVDYLKKEKKLEGLISKMSGFAFGGTDCAQPMIYALEKRIPVDVFVVMTDNETYSGNIHPFQAIKNYRKEMNIPDAKLVVIGFTATKFSIADPSDPYMLDVVGFDSSAPGIIQSFANGLI